MGNASINNFVFHNASDGIGNGNDYAVSGNADTMKLEFIQSVDGTFSATVKAQLIDDAKWYTYPIVQCSKTYTIDTVVTDNSYIYEVDLKAISKIRIEITAITGTLSVYGKCVG